MLYVNSMSIDINTLCLSFVILVEGLKVFSEKTFNWNSFKETIRSMLIKKNGALEESLTWGSVRYLKNIISSVHFPLQL